MSNLKRLVSVLLFLSMLFPAQLNWAAAIIPEETLEAAEIMQDQETAEDQETFADETRPVATEEVTTIPEEISTPREEIGDEWQTEDNHYQNTVTLAPVETTEPVEWDGDLIIYWNPSGDGLVIEETLAASPSQATNSNAAKGQAVGSDHADGLTPQTAVQSLNTAIRRAEKLSRTMDVEVSDITISAMRPMLIQNGVMYTVRGRGVTISAWSGRGDGNDLIFAIDGGQLTLSNLVLQPQDAGINPEEAELIYVKSGRIQLAEKVESYGSFVLDFKLDTPVWDWSTASDAASASQANHYTEPIIELMKKFDGASEYILDLRATGDRESVTAVSALYSDTKSTEEFLESFTLVETRGDEWNLYVEEWVGGVLRDTTEEETLTATAAEATASEVQMLKSSVKKQADIELTQKVLIASRAVRSGKIIYWNPGVAIRGADGITCPPGQDNNRDGLVATSAFKTWAKAKFEAGVGGTVICMQTIDLSDNPEQYIGAPDSVTGHYILEADDYETVIASWDQAYLPVLSIKEGKTAELRNVTLNGVQVSQYSGAQMILVEGGQLILNEKVKTAPGYIQINLVEANRLSTHPTPIIVTDESVEVKLFFGGPNNDISWNFKDVIEASGDLLAMGEETAGDILLDQIKLEAANYTLPPNGSSEYVWQLRKDTVEDGYPIKPYCLELYTTYYYHAVYLNGVDGKDEYYGNNCFYPVQTFDTARNILVSEMQKSINARAAATTEEERNKIDLPTILYICDTVTVEQTQSWDIPTFMDYDGVTPINVEIRSHVDIPEYDDGRGKVHEKPETLIHVTGSNVQLTLGSGIFVRSVTNKASSYTVAVTDGGTLSLNHNATLTGMIKSLSGDEIRTMGTHLLIGKNPVSGAITSGKVEMLGDPLNAGDGWTGKISSRSIGIEAYGTGTNIVMESGSIEDHLNIAGASSGVALFSGADFVMDGGVIASNSCHTDGAGVNMGTNTTFWLKSGRIEKNKSLKTGPESGQTEAPTLGVGVYVSANAAFTMGIEQADNAAAVIAENEASQYYQGLGVFISKNSNFLMNSGTIKQNRSKGTLTTKSNLLSNGAGVSNFGNIEVKDCLITENGAISDSSYFSNLRGVGLYLYGDSQKILGGTISNNWAGNYYTSNTTYYSRGGGIFVRRVSNSATYPVILNNLTVENNRAYYGAGVYLEGSYEITVTGCNFTGNTTSIDSQNTIPVSIANGQGGGAYSAAPGRYSGSTFTGNKSYQGGGIFTLSYADQYIDCHITENEAVIYGGGLYSNTNIYFIRGSINDNEAKSYGGGIYNTSAFYGTDMEINRNNAGADGGAIYQTSVSGYGLYLTGDTELLDNQALRGGGIYTNYGVIYLDLNGKMKNLATGENSQGNNIFLNQSGAYYDSKIYILNGELEQPDTAVAGIYNIYLESIGTKLSELYLDPTKVTIGGDDHLYLNTTNNNLKYLEAAPHSVPETVPEGPLPIDVNVNVFSIGSPIIKPANLDKVVMKVPNSGTTIGTTDVTKNYSTLKNAFTNVSYSKGSKLPERAYLGGFQDPNDDTLTNVVLLGEGVYLDGENGNDTFDGTSPTTAVQTFTKAEELLRTWTDAANLDPDPNNIGFRPFIYICGSVRLTGNQTWEIDYSHRRYNEDSKYVAAEANPEKAQIRRFSSFYNEPMVVIESGSLTIPKLIIDGMAESVETDKQKDQSPIFEVMASTKLVLQDEANIRNNYLNTIVVWGELYLTGEAGASNHQIEVTRGDGVNLYGGGLMQMDKYSRVIYSKPPASMTSTDSYFNQGLSGRGVTIDRKSVLTMNDHSKIEYTGNTINSASYVNGVVIGTDVVTADGSNKAKLIMNGNAMISKCASGIGLLNYDVDIQMNDQSSLYNNYTGINAANRGVDRISIVLDADAKISNGTNGMRYYYQNSVSETAAKKYYIDIILKGNSTIKENTSYGIYIYQMNTRFNITMETNSSIIDNNSFGIQEGQYSCYGIKLDMKGNSHIGASATGGQNYGISLNGYQYGIVGDRTGDYVIKMSDQAMIGGDVYFDGSGSKRGNAYYGIMSAKPITLEMSGESKISGNGRLLATSAAVYLDTFVFGSYPTTCYHTGDSTITLSDYASISNNRGYGIYSKDKKYGTQYYNHEKITVSDHAKLEGNDYGNQFMLETTLALTDNAKIGIPTAASYYSINTFGSLSLDGTVEVEGNIYLRTATKPITLTKAGGAGDNTDKFKLHLTEGFVGQVVVQPDLVNLSDTVPYISYFKKIIGDGIAVDKELEGRTPNIILAGENNVYLSGMGNNDNNGVTPSTAVRTFSRAKEILAGADGQRYKEGANIIICDIPGSPQNQINIPVQIIAGDEDWSFGNDGLITNQNTNESWKPIIYRHEDYKGVLIQLGHDTDETASGDTPADRVTFDHITIDGRSDSDLLADYSTAIGSRNDYTKEILKVTRGTATLGEGTVLQNNRRNMQGKSISDVEKLALGVYVESAGTVIIDGGIVQGMKVQNLSIAEQNLFGVAIYNLGKVQMNNGTIQENEISFQESLLDQNFSAGAVVNSGNATYMMSGGSIKNNLVEASRFSDFRGGGMVFLDQSSGVIHNGQLLDNKGGKGSGLYNASIGKVELEGGLIQGNLALNTTTGGSDNHYSPVYVAGTKFTLKGGAIVIEDSIYLDSTEHIITVSANIYQISRRYNVYINLGKGENQFRKGSVVVQPDGVYSQDASGTHINFNVHANPYILDRGQSVDRYGGTIPGIRENACLLLMQGVFIDSAMDDTNQGTSPIDAVKTFDRAKQVGEGNDPTDPMKNYYIIFVSGAVKPKDGEVWSLEDTAYMCRYTGFDVYDENGKSLGLALPYHDYMIQSGGMLTFENIRIYGRRVIDNEQDKNGNSMIKVNTGHNVIIKAGTLLARNYNIGSYVNKNGDTISLDRSGGAIYVDTDGSLLIEGGSITEVNAAYGKAIYQHANINDSGATQSGHVRLRNDLKINGDIFLQGKMSHGQAVVEVESNFRPLAADEKVTKLQISLANDHSGRPVVQYLDNYIPTIAQLEYYQLEDSITAIYDFTNSLHDPSLLVLYLRQLIYLDGQGGNDINSGETPDDALKSVREVYNRINSLADASGALVFVVGSIDVNSSITMTNRAIEIGGLLQYKGVYEDDSMLPPIEIDSQIFFKRYVQPPETNQAGYSVKPTNVAELFVVKNGGNLTLNGVFLDGHSVESVSNFDYLQAPGVVASAPLIRVEADGKLTAGYVDLETGQKGKQIYTKLSNNTNNHKKGIADKIGEILLEDGGVEDVIAGSSAGIEILSTSDTALGKVSLKNVSFINLELGSGVVGGSDVYQNGELSVMQETVFMGSVMLEGLGDTGNISSSRRLQVGLYGRPFMDHFQLLIRDPYNGRAVVEFPNDDIEGPADGNIGFFLLEERVNKYYSLNKRQNAKYILELTVPQAVYVGGVGADNANSGYTPKQPVETLEMAYTRLQQSGGKVIYIMGTINVDASTELTATSYKSGTKEVALMSSTDHVDIRRYAKPIIGFNSILNPNPNYNADYDVESFYGTLFEVQSDVTFQIHHHVYVDGHYPERLDPQVTKEFRVNEPTLAKGPLIEVKQGGTLKLYQNSRLFENYNSETMTGTGTKIAGGAICNNGTVELNKGQIIDNFAEKGAGIYQNGTFEIIDSPQGIEDQEIYLTTVNTGTTDEPIWGEARTLNTAVLLPSGLELDLQMDHPIAGRPVVRYTADTAVDSQHVNYKLGDTVPMNLYLVERGGVMADPSLLELQDWRVLDISVPKEIFLVIQQTRTGDLHASTAATNELMLTSPEYTIANHGRYDAKISLSGFINQNTEAGITEFDQMRLVPSPSDALSASAKRTDLYLAIKHANNTDKFAGLPETSLYNFGVDGVNKQEMGLLLSGEEANFTFVAEASRRFMAYYADPAFPFFGSNITAADRIAHIRHKNAVSEVTSANNARAKFKMTYRVEIMPSRR